MSKRTFIFPWYCSAARESSCLDPLPPFPCLPNEPIVVVHLPGWPNILQHRHRACGFKRFRQSFRRGGSACTSTFCLTCVACVVYIGADLSTRRGIFATIGGGGQARFDYLVESVVFLINIMSSLTDICNQATRVAHVWQELIIYNASNPPYPAGKMGRKML